MSDKSTSSENPEKNSNSYPDKDVEYIDFATLIQASGAESSEALGDPATALPWVNHPREIVVTWLLCLLFGWGFLIQSPYPQKTIGERGVMTRLGIAVYHVAHRVETYRQYTGGLPDYLEPEWHETEKVEYQVVDGQYLLTAREGDRIMTYRQGQNPDALLFADWDLSANNYE
ncbi:MAG: hypothetical protein ACI9FB_000605 [Candidatus Azotimanducaceae bacterium]|jgi:hypothetical protein